MNSFFHSMFSNQTEIEYWERVYDREDFCGMFYRSRMTQALAWVRDSNLSKNPVILDAGCGPGITTRQVAEDGFKVLGIDYSVGMIRRANTICSSLTKQNVTFTQGDIEFLPCKTSSFDIVLCLGVLTYLESLENAMREFSRVTKMNGTLVFTVVNKACLAKNLDMPMAFRRMLQKALTARITSWKRGQKIKKPWLRKAYFIPSIANLLKRHGFTLLEYRTFPIGLLTFLGREIIPRRANMKIIMSFEKLKNVPLISSFGGMCMFRVMKSRTSPEFCEV